MVESLVIGNLFDAEQSIVKLWNSNDISTIDARHKSYVDEIIINYDIIRKSSMDDTLYGLKAMINESLDKNIKKSIQLWKNKGSYLSSRSFTKLYESLTWQKPYFLTSLRILGSEASRDEILMLSFNIESAVRLCLARKIESFTFLAMSAYSKYCQSNPKASCEIALSLKDKCAQNVRKEIIQKIHEIREKVFEQEFLHPAEQFYQRKWDHILEGEVRIHGTNVYQGILLSTLGIRFNRSLFLFDANTAAPDFLHECSKLGEGKSAFAIANQALTLMDEKILKEYLNLFVKHFKKETILPILAKFLTSTVAKDQLEICFKQFQQSQKSNKMKIATFDENHNIVFHSMTDESSCYDFFWIIDENHFENSVENLTNTLEFLRFLKIIKP